MLLGVEGGRWWMRGLPAQSLAFISYSSLASFGDYPLMASVAPLAVDLRPRLFVSDSLAFLSSHQAQRVYRLSFYSFRPFILLLPSIGTTATFSLRFDSEYPVLPST